MDTVEKTTSPKVWTLDKAHAKLGFAITHMMVSEIEGSFKNFDIKFNVPNDDFSGAEVEVTADVHSIDTANEMRDNHLKQADFFHAEKNPTLTFKSKSFVKVADKKYALNGDLTFNGVTKNVSLDVKGNVVQHPMKPTITIAGFKISGEVKRSDFNFGGNFPAIALSNDVAINCNVEFTAE
ncbi:MAG TPA: YceI family protein [Bacteroidia bacterium]|jgi:polyisoprenoid-binding protein YceI|nr:YceI family protein [Bacteroidia bacterium]